MFVYNVIVTFNSIKWIEKVINSLNRGTKQTNLIIGDNGSKYGKLMFYNKVQNLRRVFSFMNYLF